MCGAETPDHRATQGAAVQLMEGSAKEGDEMRPYGRAMYEAVPESLQRAAVRTRRCTLCSDMYSLKRRILVAV